MFQKFSDKFEDGAWVKWLFILGWPGGMLISILLMMFGVDTLSGYWALFSAASFFFLIAGCLSDGKGFWSTVGTFIVILIVVFGSASFFSG